MNIGSLCTGYGGLDLACETFFDAETIWVAENEKYAAQVAEKRISSNNLGDITDIDWYDIERPEILTAGYPCQPFSQAGSRKGVEDDRHIFPFIGDAISVLRPRVVVLENVSNHLSLGFGDVLGTLASLGYNARWCCLRASDAGAPHRRERVFIVAFNANPDCLRCERPFSESRWNFSRDFEGFEQQVEFLLPTTTTKDASSRNSTLNRVGYKHSGDTLNDITWKGFDWEKYQPAVSRWEMITGVPCPSPNVEGEKKLSPFFSEWMMGLPEGWVTDLVDKRTHRFRILGNGVVPQQAYSALEMLLS